MTSVAVRTIGGGAGTSIRRALSRQIASTMPVSAERVRARASTLGSMRQHAARHLVGHLVAGARASTSAGVQRTENDALELLAAPLRRRRWRRQRNHRAPRGELDRPHRDPAQPADARRRRRRRPGRLRRRPAIRGPRRPGRRTRRRRPRPAERTGVCWIHPDVGRTGGAEHLHDRVAVGARPCRGPRPRPRRVPAPTTPAPGPRPAPAPVPRGARRPRSDRSPRSTSGSTTARRFALRSMPLNRAHAVDSRRRSDCASASTWSRSSPGSERAATTNSSASRSRRSSALAPSGAIGLEDRELLGGGVAVGLGLDPEVELPRRDRGGRERLRHRHGRPT